MTIISDLKTMTSAVFCRGWNRSSTISRPQLWNKAENWPRFSLSVPISEEEDRGRPMLMLLARSRGLTSMLTSVPSSPSWTRSRPSWAGARSGDSVTSAGRYQAGQEIGSISWCHVCILEMGRECGVSTPTLSTPYDKYLSVVSVFSRPQQLSILNQYEYELPLLHFPSHIFS